MSHFTVAVITRKNPYESNAVEDMLERFDENISVPYYAYETKEDFLKKEREQLESFKNTTYAEYLSDTKKYLDECRNESHKEYVENFMHYYNVSDEELLQKRKVQYKSKDDCDLDGCDYIDEEETVYTTYNPESKWDWYSIGGRWDCLLKLKDGNVANCAKIKDVDFGFDIDYDKESHDEDIIKQYNELMTNGDGWYRKEYLKEIYPTIIEYIRSIKQFITYAILDPDGNWLEKGEMGWFAVSSATPEDEIDWAKEYPNVINSFNPEYYITIVDCHI